MRKQLNITIVLLVIIIGLLSAGYFISDKFAGRSSVYSDTGGVLEVEKNETASTSPSYFTAGTTASSTFEVDITGATNLALNWSLKASTTATVLQYEIFYTNDTLASTTDYYQERSVSTGTVSANSTLYTWTPANSNASTTYATVDIDGARANNVKIEYNLSGDNGAVTLEVAAQ